MRLTVCTLDCHRRCHYDGNKGADALIAFAVNGVERACTKPLVGGDHVMWSHDGKTAVVVETATIGTLILANHQHLLHGNTATRHGGRIIFAFYASKKDLDHAPLRKKQRPAGETKKLSP